MSHNYMRIPWLATLDALVEELERHVDKRVFDVSLRDCDSPDGKGRGVLHILQNNSSVFTAQDHIRSAIQNLLDARCDLENIPHEALPSKGNQRDRQSRISDLDSLEERLIRYPDLEGKEGVARLVERGGLVGPLLGAHIATVIRGEASLKSGSQSTFDQGRERRFAVKRIATIQHLYDVGLKKAVLMFCDAQDGEDPDATAIGKYEQWVKRDRRAAKKRLEDVSLSERDVGHFKAILDGLHPDLPRGILRGQPYPDALDELRKARS